MKQHYSSTGTKPIYPVNIESVIHDKLLSVFLTVDDGGGDAPPINGVRKAQVILATHYLVQGRREYAQQIQQEFAEENNKYLWGLMQVTLVTGKI